MDLASIFKPRTAASSRFRPFYGEIGGFPWGYEKEGTYGPGIERQPTGPGGPNLMSEKVGGVPGQDEVYVPQQGVTAGAPEIEPVDFGGAGYGGGGGDYDDGDYEEPESTWDYDDPLIAGTQLDVQKGFLPTSTPTFSVHNPYYGDDYEAERWYSGSYGWRLPGGPHYSAPSGGYNPYQKWGGTDMQYALGSFGPENEAAWGTNVTPYVDRWFYEDSLLPPHYDKLVQDVVFNPSSDPDVFADIRGIIPDWVGLHEPVVSGHVEYQPPKEMTLWGTPHTAYSRVNQLSEPSFVDPYYEDLYNFGNEPYWS